jgi:hypothetical protein
MSIGDLYREASKASIAIDNHLLNRATSEEYQTIQNLSNRLYKISKEQDFSDLMIMAKTIWPNRKDWEGKGWEDVKLQTSLLKMDLSTLKDLPKERQESLRDTCVRLSKEHLYYLCERYSLVT